MRPRRVRSSGLCRGRPEGQREGDRRDGGQVHPRQDGPVPQLGGRLQGRQELHGVHPQEALEKFAKAKIEDFDAHYKGKTVRVTGTVTLYRDKPQTKVEDPDQIKIINKK
jgi:hypothetical protein